MKQDHKKCGYCGSYSAYYTRGYCSLFKESIGYCNKHKKIMDKTDGCDNGIAAVCPKNGARELS